MAITIEVDTLCIREKKMAFLRQKGLFPLDLYKYMPLIPITTKSEYINKCHLYNFIMLWMWLKDIFTISHCRNRDYYYNDVTMSANCVSYHRRPHCLLNCCFGRRSMKASKLRVTGLCARNSPVTGEFPAQRTSNAESVPIRRRHHGWIPLCGRNILSYYLLVLSM